MQRTLSAIASGRLKNHLKRGGLIAYPTESSYGLGCLPTHTQALKKLIRLKRRPQHKGMIVIGDTLDRLRPLLHPLGETDRRLLGQPLVSTSCNKAGKRPCRNQREARRQFGRHALIIGGRCGGAKKPSLIIDWENGRQLR